MNYGDYCLTPIHCIPFKTNREGTGDVSMSIQCSIAREPPSPFCGYFGMITAVYVARQGFNQCRCEISISSYMNNYGVLFHIHSVCRRV